MGFRQRITGGVVMKYLTFLAMCFLVGCASTAINKESYTSKLDFDIPAGQYEQYQLATWHKGDSECIEFSLQKPYNTTKWGASVMLYMQGESKDDISKISLFTEYQNSRTLSLAFVNSDAENTIIERNISFGENVKFEATFPDDHTIKIRIGKSEYIYPIGFAVQNLLVGASSAEAAVKFFDNQTCDTSNPG